MVRLLGRVRGKSGQITFEEPPTFVHGALEQRDGTSFVAMLPPRSETPILNTLGPPLIDDPGDTKGGPK